jgi:hypothetical protein
MSLHLQQYAIGSHIGMQARDFSNHSSSEQPTHLNMSPQRGQYNNVLANNTYLVAVVK